MTRPSKAIGSLPGGVKRRFRRVPGGSGALVRMKIPIALMSVMYANRKLSALL